MVHQREGKMLIAIRLNPIKGNAKINEDGDLEGDWEFDDSEEVLVHVDVEDIWDIENGIQDIKESLYSWQKHHG